ncbi:GntR family transcriptional regulator [Pseudochelatococcus sp. B33]
MTDERLDEASGRANRVFRLLEELIVSGELAPGDRLDERALAERFNVSRTPVREALSRLSASGLVVNRGRQSAYVAAISVTELFQTFEVMAELEGLCAKLAAQRMTNAEREELLALAKSFEPTGSKSDLHTYMDLNEKFHHLIYRGAHNPVLEDIVHQVYRRVARYRRYTLRANGRMRESAKEHLATAEAICGGHAEEARKAMEYHIDIRRLDHADFVTFLARLNEESKL